MVKHGGTHRPVGQHHGAVGRAAPHLGSVGRGPCDVQPLGHAGLRQVFADGKTALPAEAGNNNFLFHLTSPPQPYP
ncbi:hypothetical protein SDC9_163807 [bioreactor metagenome]|uniref:Uncharacterized protein n=1 Tax=bioreactor metagenome TaxID=1076179 RepID=A0A645FX17_9ZZZZ